MDWHQGKSYDESQCIRGVSRRVVAKWRKRFSKLRLDGLVDAYRSGKPVVVTEVQKNRVVHLACNKPSKGYSNWSQERIAKKLELAQARIIKF